ncbi:MAG: hypothetical protein CI947_939, partial [Halanaerobium sp.]
SAASDVYKRQVVRLLDGKIKGAVDLVFPEKDSNEIKLSLNNSEIKINELNISEMNSIW